RRWGLGLVGVVIGCSSLPEFAAPRGRVTEPNEIANGDLIRYRALTRADFQASAPPAEAAAHAKKLGALTCAYIATTPNTAYEIRFSRLGFLAQMCRGCSWWNSDNRADDEAYVLQHEQIHFGLAEVEARRRNRQARELLASWSERTDSADEAKRLVEAKLEALVNEAMADLLDVSEDFDEDTSAKHAPTKQDAWERQVNEELASLADYSNP